MGTSASSTGPNNQSPLVPPWAEQSDPVKIGSGEVGNGDQDASDNDGGAQESGKEPNKEIDNGKVQEQIPGPVTIALPANRFAGARRSFGEYARSGGGEPNLRRSLRKYAKSSGGGSATSRRLASGITAGTGLIGMIRGDSVTVNNATLSLSELHGLTTDQAIDRITEHLTPENGDADAVRIAMDYALVEALPDEDNFDTDVFTDDVIQEVISCYLTDLIFQDVVTGMGKAWFYVEHPSKHYKMEEELRELIKVITQEKIDKVTHGNVENITKENITNIQINAISHTVEDWESFDD